MILEYFHFVTKFSMRFSELSMKNFLTSIRLSRDRVQMLGIIIHNFEFINIYEAQLHLVVNGGFEVHCLQHYYQTFWILIAVSRKFRIQHTNTDARGGRDYKGN